MPASSTRLEQEGVVIPPTLVSDEDLAGLAGRMRNPAQRLADLRAQRAANLTGIERLRELAARDGVERLQAGMGEILDYAERRTRAALAALPDGESTVTDELEGLGGPIALRVRATLSGESLTLDFEGTASQVDGNLNCPLSVTRSACFYAVRVVCDPDAPPSAGAWRPVEVLAPEGSLLNARAPAAVAAGNVETSSRVADLVFDALAAFAPVPANGQGTMNNLTLAGGRGDTNGPTTRRSAAARAPALMPTGRARCTWRCRTRSTPRSRRSRRSSRCACASSPCGAAAAARAATEEERGSCARSRRSSRCATR